MTTTPKPPSPNALTFHSILPRQLSSLALTIFLYTAATPFSPISWLTGPLTLSGTYLLDRLLAGLILFCAFYFQWAIASLRSAVIISIPTGGTTTTIRNGRVEQNRGGSVALWVWRTEEYWVWAVVEGALLGVAEWAGSETMRRLIVVGVVGAVWLVGWAATPVALKSWAWKHVKVYLFVLVLDELRNVGVGAVRGMAGGAGRRRRW